MELANVFTLALECADAVMFLDTLAPTKENIDREKMIVKAIMDHLEGRSGVPAC